MLSSCASAAKIATKRAEPTHSFFQNVKKFFQQLGSVGWSTAQSKFAWAGCAGA